MRVWSTRTQLRILEAQAPTKATSRRRMGSSVDSESRNGPMVVIMKVSGRTAKLQERESFGTLMETCMKATGWMIKLMATAIISTLMARCTLATGSLTGRRDMVRRSGPMEATTRASISKV